MTDSQGTDEHRPVSEHELNPVGRLYLYLSHVGNRADNEDLVQCVASYIGVSRDDVTELHRAAFELASLRDEAAELISSAPRLPGRKAALAELDNIEHSFRSTMVLNGAVIQFRNAYDPGALRALEMMSETVNQWRQANPDAAQGGIDDVRQALLDLAEQLRTDDSVDQEIRSLLSRHVHKLSACVDQFYIGGVDAVVDELKKLFGEFVLDTEIQKQAGPGKPIWDWFVQVANSVRDVAAIAGAVHAVWTGVPLPSLPPIYLAPRERPALESGSESPA